MNVIFIALIVCIIEWGVQKVVRAMIYNSMVLTSKRNTAPLKMMMVGIILIHLILNQLTSFFILYFIPDPVA